MMFNFKRFSNIFTKLSALLLLLSLSSFSYAAPYTVTYVDVLGNNGGGVTSSPPYNLGEAFTISIVLDNGGTTTASQTWTSADIVSITFSMNDAPNTITTVFAPVVLATNAGSFVTDAAGVLTAVPSNWNDNNGAVGTLSTVASTNDPNTPSSFFINGVFEVYYSNSIANPTDGFDTRANMNDVVNNIVAAFWTNPVTAMNPGGATAVPTLSQWAMILLSLMLMGIGLLKTRRMD